MKPVVSDVTTEGKPVCDAAKGVITNNEEANRWVKPTFRKGWELKL